MIDAIIPVYNGEKYIDEAIQSVIDQTIPLHKIIIVNDGSTDTTKDRIAKYEQRYPDLIKNIYKENGGLSSARNRGIKESTADYVAFLDADDVWENTKLEEQMRVFENTEYPMLGLVYCKYEIIDSTGMVDKNGDIVQLDTTIQGNAFEKILSANKILSSGSGVLVKRSVFDTVGLFDETLRFGEDWDMWIRIARVYQISFTARVLVKIRRHEKNMTGNPLLSFRGEILFFEKWIQILKHNTPIPSAWGDRIVTLALMRLPKVDFLQSVHTLLKRETRMILFKKTSGSFYLYVLFFLLKNIFLIRKIVRHLTKKYA